MLCFRSLNLTIEKFPRFGKFPEYRNVRDQVSLEIYKSSDNSFTLMIRNTNIVSDTYVSRMPKIVANAGEKSFCLLLPEVRVSILVQGADDAATALIQKLTADVPEEENIAPNAQVGKIKHSDERLNSLRSQESENVIQTTTRVSSSAPSATCTQTVTPTKSPHKKKSKCNRSPSLSAVKLKFSDDISTSAPLKTTIHKYFQVAAPIKRATSSREPCKDEVKSMAIYGLTNSGASSNACRLTHEQSDVVAACREGVSLLITGGAGTGKSYLIDLISKEMIKLHGKQSVFITATTGLAAVAIGGSTIHQFAGLPAFDNDMSLSPDAFVKQVTFLINYNKF